MILAALTPDVKGGVNPGASLLWLLSSSVIIGIALTKEMEMVRMYGQTYPGYQKNTALTLLVGKFVSSLISVPSRLLFRRNLPQNEMQVFVLVSIYFFSCPYRCHFLGGLLGHFDY
ncbi:MAG: hypothetical protein ACUVTR_03420 [Dehalococcoidia bacterium]